MTNVFTLKQAAPREDIVAGLRELADALESARFESPVTTAIVVFGHTWHDGEKNRLANATFAFGPRVDVLTVKGLLLHSSQI